MTNRMITFVCLLLGLTLSDGGMAQTQPSNPSNTITMEKKLIGNTLALYPMPLTVVGAEVDGRVNWLVVAHVGIIGHDRILVSMSQSHYTNQGIKASRKLSVNLVSREMLPEADYVGSVSGARVDKSQAFAWHRGANGTPVIDRSPLTMECDVVDIYETEGFDNFICSIAATYASPEVLDDRGRIDYARLKPVLFEFPTYSLSLDGRGDRPLSAARQRTVDVRQGADGRGRHRTPFEDRGPAGYLDEYMAFAAEVGEISLRTEPGVLTMYAVAERENPCRITILETYASRAAYERHIASAHFQKYKQGTLHMVRSLEMVDQTPLNPANCLRNFIR